MINREIPAWTDVRSGDVVTIDDSEDVGHLTLAVRLRGETVRLPMAEFREAFRPATAGEISAAGL